MSRKRRMRGSRLQVHRERCHLTGDQVVPPVADAPIGTVIPRVLKKLGLEQDLWIGELENEWASLVGAAVAAHTRPGRIERKRLYVFVDSAVWLFELKRIGEKEMLQKLQARFGADRLAAISLQPAPD